LLYKNKDALKNIGGLMDHVDIHIGKLNRFPPPDPNRDKWRKEIRAAIDKARKWTNRMSPGMRQDMMNRLINAAEAAVPQD
jgi:hypothetical protein